LNPADLQSAYNLPSAAAGSGQIVAIVDAFNDPNAESDLASYRSQFGLPPCTTANGCFRKVNQNGATSPLPSNNVGWGEEISLDIDMVSAICPNCNILLVEANSSSFTDLGTSVNTAVRLGADAISNSYGGSETSNETTLDTSFYFHKGVAITASADAVEYPAASQFVTAVGGTSLTRASNTRGWNETALDGGGCSAFEPKPAWQTDKVCSKRTLVDVSAVADPNTGVSVVDTFGTGTTWLVFGGTSVGSPIIASVYALASNARSIGPGFPYAHADHLNDITSCTDGSNCGAGPGYDPPTGLGTPNGTGAF